MVMWLPRESTTTPSRRSISARILAVGADQRRSRAVVVEVDDDLGLGRNLHVAVKFAAGSERR